MGFLLYINCTYKTILVHEPSADVKLMLKHFGHALNGLSVHMDAKISMIQIATYSADIKQVILSFTNIPVNACLFCIT